MLAGKLLVVAAAAGPCLPLWARATEMLELRLSENMKTSCHRMVQHGA